MWPSWAVRPIEPRGFGGSNSNKLVFYAQSTGAVISGDGFGGHKAILNHAHALVTVCPYYVNLTSKDIKLHIISSSSCRVMIWATAKGK